MSEARTADAPTAATVRSRPSRSPRAMGPPSSVREVRTRRVRRRRPSCRGFLRPSPGCTAPRAGHRRPWRSRRQALLAPSCARPRWTRDFIPETETLTISAAARTVMPSSSTSVIASRYGDARRATNIVRHDASSCAADCSLSPPSGFAGSMADASPTSGCLLRFRPRFRSKIRSFMRTAWICASRIGSRARGSTLVPQEHE